jgi:hypothetical protein
MAMREALASLMGPPLTRNPASLGTGSPPTMPGLPPSPQMVGQMPVGSTSTTAKGAADAAILALRDAKGYFPNLGDAIEGIIGQLKSAAQQHGKPPPPVGFPGGPGAAVSESSPTQDSGTPGGI